MTNAEIANILRCDKHLTEHDIRMHIRNGTFVYESFADFRDSFCPGDNSEEELVEMWNDLRIIVDDSGKEYRVDFVL